jgi:prepilin-type N-terminal cleavage/methylation domain-containing protein
MKTYQRGFTIIEVLVASAILTVMGTIVYASFSDAREKGRDAAQKTQLTQIELALRAYYEANGTYPPPASINVSCREGVSVANGRSWYSSARAGCSQQYLPGLVPTYIAELPTHADSRNPSCRYIYIVATDGQRYKLLAENCAEGEVVVPGDEFYRCPITANGTGECLPANASSNAQSFAVYSRGAENW